jgi:hypothetical protein
MSRFNLLDRTLAHDDNFRDFFSTLTEGSSWYDHLNGTNWGHAHHHRGGDGTQAANPPPVDTPPPVVSSPPVIDPPPVDTPPPVVSSPPVIDPPHVDNPPPVVSAPPVVDPPHVDNPPPVVSAPPVVDPPHVDNPPPVTSAPPVTSTPPVTSAPPVDNPPPVASSPPATDPAHSAAPATLSADWATSNTDAGPYWAMNSTWNENGLVNGTGFTQSLTMENPDSPNIGTTITWNWPNTPAGYNVYSYPAVFYGDYAGFNAPANNVTAEQINSLKTLTLSQNVSFSGNTDQYDGMYDGYTTSKPDGDSSTVQHEVEVYIHSPGYVQDWIENLPQHQFTDSQGLQWTIATQGNIVIFAPSDFRDLTNYTTDLKGLLQAAVADGVMSGSEYFNGIALGNEPREGSGSMTINSLTVNYDGDHTASAAATTAAAATPVASSAAVTHSPAVTDSAAAPSNSQPAASPAAVTSTPPVTNTTAVNNTHSTTAASQDSPLVPAIHDGTSFAHQHAHFEHMWG